jgi:hypothetical protein
LNPADPVKQVDGEGRSDHQSLLEGFCWSAWRPGAMTTMV